MDVPPTFATVWWQNRGAWVAQDRQKETLFLTDTRQRVLTIIYGRIRVSRNRRGAYFGS